MQMSKGDVLMRNLRKILATTIAIVTLISLFTVNVTGFTDVPEDHYAYTAIEKLADKGIIEAERDGAFNPNEMVTRAEFARMVNLAFGFTTKGDNKFKDVPADAAYANDIAIAIAAGYLYGYNGYAYPEAVIQRQQVAVIGYRVFEKLGLIGSDQQDTPFSDIDDAASWAQKEIIEMAKLGAVHGYNGKFDPLRNLSRAETAVLLANMLEIVESKQKEITIFFTSDLHGAFAGKNFATNATHQGLSRVATELINRQKALDAAGSRYLSLDLGDTIQGAGTTGFIGNTDYTYPVFKGINYLKYDIAVPGNHEFNFGVPAMLTAYNGTEGAAVGFGGVKLCGNVFKGDFTDDASVTGKDPLLPEFKAYEIFDLDGVRVAVIGMTNPGSDTWDAIKMQDAGYYTESVIGAAKRAIAEIKDGDKADVIVLAAHMSIDDSFDRPGSGAASVLADPYIAKNVDAFLGAHGHSRGARLINGVRYGENSANGSSLGVVRIKVTNIDGKWVVVDKADSAVSITMQQVSFEGERNALPQNIRDEDAGYVKHLQPEIDFAIKYTTLKIGELINGNMINASPLGSGMNIAYTEPTKLVDFIHSVQLYYGEADISVACPFSMNVQHLEGDITRGSLIGIYNYDSNTIYRLEMKGWQVKKFIEYVARTQFTTPDTKTDLSIRHIPSYRTDSFGGLKYTIDLTKPENSRVTITEVKRNGIWEKFDPDATYFVAANDYRTSSGIMSKTSGILSEEDLAAPDAPKVLQTDCNRGRPIAPDILSLMVDYIQNVKGGVIDAAEFESTWEIIPWWDTAADGLRAEGERLIAEGKIAADNMPAPDKALTVEVVLAALEAETPLAPAA